MTDKGKKEIEKKNIVLKELKIHYVPHENIRPNRYNPNRQSEHEFKLLLKSMGEDGFTQPVIVKQDEGNAHTGEIVDGEHRWKASKELGYKEIPVVFVNMTSEQMRISTLRHNRARGNEDIQLTANVLRDLRELGALDWAMDSLELTEIEVDRLLDDIPAPEALANEEYKEAWLPTKSGVQSVDGGKENATQGGMAYQTEAAYTKVREIEAKIKEAHSEEERTMAVKENNTFNLSLTFSNDEAKIVKDALGASPADTILTMCRTKLGINE